MIFFSSAQVEKSGVEILSGSFNKKTGRKQRTLTRERTPIRERTPTRERTLTRERKL